MPLTISGRSSISVRSPPSRLSEAGLAQDDVAALLGVRRAAVARWERAERASSVPGWALRRIALVHGVSGARLLALGGTTGQNRSGA